MNMPGKKMLRAFADAVGDTTKDMMLIGDTGLRYAAARFLYDLANEQEPEEPKVESLRDASVRLWSWKGKDCSARAVADLVALAVRRIDRLEELIQHEFKMSGRTQSSLQKERDEMSRMLEGSK